MLIRANALFMICLVTAPVLSTVRFDDAVFRCRFTVRDVGFVDLDEKRFRIVFSPPTGAGPRWFDVAKQIAKAVYLDANADVVAWGSLDPSESREIASTLTGRGGVALLTPDGRIKAVPLPDDPAALTDEGWEIIESVVESPVRSNFLEHTVNSHALVVFFDGMDGIANDRALAVAREAIAEANKALPELPKPAKSGPRLIRVEHGDRGSERFLLFALGLEESMDEDPRVAVLYGRGKRMGETLEGGLITMTSVLDQLLLVGQNCECELDRDLFKSPRIPLVWNDDARQQVVDVLEFDAENPMVKAEISRILAKSGTNAGGERPKLSADLLGYHEEAVESRDEPAPVEVAPQGQGDRPEAPEELSPKDVARSIVNITLGIIIGGVLVGIAVILVLKRR